MIDNLDNPTPMVDEEELLDDVAEEIARRVKEKTAEAAKATAVGHGFDYLGVF